MSLEIQTPQKLLKQVTEEAVDYEKLITITNNQKIIVIVFPFIILPYTEQ